MARNFGLSPLMSLKFWASKKFAIHLHIFLKMNLEPILWASGQKMEFSKTENFFALMKPDFID